MKSESWNPLLKSYPDSERVNRASVGAETLYTRLIAQTDDNGHYYGDPEWVLAKLFTHRMIGRQVKVEDVEAWIEELVGVGLIVLYQVEKVSYIEMVNVKKCLRPDVKPEVRFPIPTDTARVRAVPVTHSGRVRDEHVSTGRNGHGPRAGR